MSTSWLLTKRCCLVHVLSKALFLGCLEMRSGRGHQALRPFPASEARTEPTLPGPEQPYGLKGRLSPSCSARS